MKLLSFKNLSPQSQAYAIHQYLCGWQVTHDTEDELDFEETWNELMSDENAYYDSEGCYYGEDG